MSKCGACRDMMSAHEFEGLVQRNMAANCGMNYFSVAQFLGYIAVRQVLRLQSPTAWDSLLDAYSLHRCMLVLSHLAAALRSAYQVESASVDEADSGREALEELLEGLNAAEEPCRVVASLEELVSACQTVIANHSSAEKQGECQE